MSRERENTVSSIPMTMSDFIANLPVTIREDVGFAVFMYSFDPGELVRVVTRDTTHDFVAFIQHRLLQAPQWPDHMGLIIRIIGAIDYTLLARTQTAARAAARAKNAAAKLPGMRDVQALALRAPMARKHFEAAEKKWANLRAGPLSVSSLVAFEHELRTRAYPSLTVVR